MNLYRATVKNPQPKPQKEERQSLASMLGGSQNDDDDTICIFIAAESYTDAIRKFEVQTGRSEQDVLALGVWPDKFLT